MNRQTIIVTVTLAFGIVVGIVGTMLTEPSAHKQTTTSEAEDPLYWVAPMDPNYRRDEPGKSPMGMDLVPVYAEDMNKGSVTISPNVQHNMGVRTEPVRRGQLTDRLFTLARVEVAEDQVSVVSPRMEGWLEKLHVRTTNESVVAGQPLFELYSPALVNAQEEFVSALGTSNRALIDSARSRLQALRVPSTLLQRLEKTRKVEQTVTFPAQHSGIVSELAVREGGYVTPATRMMTITGLDPVWISAEVFETDIKRLGTGNEMTVRVSRNEVVRASIDFVQPILAAVTRTLEVRATVPNPNGDLKPNMFAEADIQLRSEDDLLLVPSDALIRVGNQTRVVLAMNDEQFKSVAVDVGRVSGRDAEVLAGLREGDRVVTSAQFLIDSESSKSSDFKRMDLAQALDHSKMDHSKMDHSAMQQEVDHSNMDHSDMSGDANANAVWVRASIRSVDMERGVLNLTHDPIPEWQWPTMTMMMNAGPAVDLNSIKAGASYRAHVMEAPESDTGYVVMHLEPLGE